MGKQQKNLDKYVGLIDKDLFISMLRDSVLHTNEMKNEVDDAYIKTILHMLHDHIARNVENLSNAIKVSTKSAKEILSMGFKIKEVSRFQIQCSDAWIVGFCSGFSNAIMDVLEEMQDRTEENTQ